VWTSSDGRAWAAQPDSGFAGLTLEAVTNDGTDFYAWASPRTSLWRSRDGSAWQQVDLPVGGGELGVGTVFDGSHVSDATAVDGTIYAGGGASVVGGDIACDCVGTWRSENGVDWEASQPSMEDTFQAFAAKPNLLLVIMAGGYIGRGLWYSTNFFDWAEPDLQVDESMGFLDATSDGQRIVAVGYGGDEFDQAVALVTDGSTWTVQTIGSGFPPAEQVAWAGGTFVAVGAERATPGTSWWSTDGAVWTRGPNIPFPPPDPMPPEGGDNPFVDRTMGAGTPGFILTQTYDEGLHVWFAPLGAFD
jgi:hypothetical protein